MSKIKLISTTIVGFGSIVEPLTYSWTKKGITTVVGDNGVGKTSIFNALSWCLYQQLLKKGASVETWDGVRGSNWQGTMVGTVLRIDDVKYHIVRTVNYKLKWKNHPIKNGLFIFKDGAHVDIRNKGDKQKYIQELLGYSFDLFKASILIGQKMKTLMEDDGPNKKKVLEEAFDASFISRAKEMVSKRLLEKTSKLMALEVNYNGVKDSLKYIKSELSTIDKAIAEFEENKQKRIYRIKSDIEAVKKRIEDYDSRELERCLEKMEEINAKVNALKNYPDDLVSQELKLNFKLNAAKEQIELNDQKIKELKEDGMPAKKCPVCGNKLPKEKGKELLKEEIAKLKNGNLQYLVDIEKLEEKYQQILTQLDEWKAQKEKLKGLETKAKELNDKRIQLRIKESEAMGAKKQLLMLRSDLRDVKGESCQLSKDEAIKNLKELKEKKKTLKGDYVTLRKEVKIDNWLIKDPLSNSGLKAFIFDSMLSQLNQNLSKYFHIIGFTIKVLVDLESANKDIRIIIGKEKDLVLYEDLSGGQKQLTNIALIFALNDCVTKSKPINVLILDEIFESLSRKNTELVMDIISTQLSTNRNIHLITHNQEFIPTNSHRIELRLNKLGQTVVYTS